MTPADAALHVANYLHVVHGTQSFDHLVRARLAQLLASSADLQTLFLHHPDVVLAVKAAHKRKAAMVEATAAKRPFNAAIPPVLQNLRPYGLAGQLVDTRLILVSSTRDI